MGLRNQATRTIARPRRAETAPSLLNDRGKGGGRAPGGHARRSQGRNSPGRDARHCAGAPGGFGLAIAAVCSVSVPPDAACASGRPQPGPCRCRLDACNEILTRHARRVRTLLAAPGADVRLAVPRSSSPACRASLAAPPCCAHAARFQTSLARLRPALRCRAHSPAAMRCTAASRAGRDMLQPTSWSAAAAAKAPRRGVTR